MAYARATSDRKIALHAETETSAKGHFHFSSLICAAQALFCATIKSKALQGSDLSTHQVLSSGAQLAARADGTCVKRVSSQPHSQLQDRLPRPSTLDLKAGVHCLSLQEAYGPTWSSLGFSLAKSTFCRPTRGALRSGRGTVSGHLWSGKTPLNFHF